MDKCTWINPRKLNSKLAVRKLENQLILPFVSYPKTQKRHQKVEKMGLKTGEMVDSAEAAIQAPDLESCSHMEVPAPLNQPLTPLQQDAGALVPGEGKIVSLKWETPVHLRCGCCVKAGELESICIPRLSSPTCLPKCWQPESSHSSRRQKHLSLRNQPRLREKLKDSDIKNSLMKECSHFTAQMLHPPVQSCF